MKPGRLPAEYVDKVVNEALMEDAGRGDVTSEILIPCDLHGKAYMLVKEEGILAGIRVAERVFHQIDPSFKIEVLMEDSVRVKKGDIPLLVSGPVQGILRGERVALNFLQRMSGIASTTARYVAKVHDLGVDIADTRKTTPGLRFLEKYAVRMGGGRNHRLDLSDAVLIKDNHIAALRALGMSYREIVEKARHTAPPDIKIEAEATSFQEAAEALEAGADIIMLDNMNIGDMIRAVELIAGRAEVEASGGVNLSTVRAIAETGVDFISVGALTHSYQALDISLEIESQTFKLV